MLSDSQFQSLSRDILTRIHDALDGAFENGALDELELEPGLLTIVTGTGRTFIVSAHGPTGEIWLASPLSGGLHFAWDGTQWIKNGETLEFVLTRDLQSQQVECAL
jgi:iron donor protein CyaY